MKPFAYSNRLLLSVALLLTCLLACTNEDPTLPVADVALRSTSLGRVLTGPDGKTLYVFAPDANGQSNCAGNCLTNWPIYYKENPVVGSGMVASDFTTITRADGSKQTAYQGWPLYYFKNDVKPGDVVGENVGNVWFVAKPNYNILIASRQLVGMDGKNYTFDMREGTGNSLYLTDGQGRTLYAFINDRRNKNNYTRADLSNNPTWPIFELPSGQTAIGELPSTLNRADFTTTTIHGKTQVTYKGWPLYYFGGDQGQRGSNKGVSVPRPGVWPVVFKNTPEAPVQ
ncbi:hypothetical protein [Spirosoma montaniterrae]|uniref:Lipoprotein n=1 Tax=Spirosoma montaniterrae TaxID=1178516 RepID=A0A1P9X2R1_9BACT|nr:hypothetical protein [Spirosoma montaniterrae]AQG81910.1 hypothetical protein AWR27_23005 [Spirosoma montaniterrae]